MDSSRVDDMPPNSRLLPAGDLDAGAERLRAIIKQKINRQLRLFADVCQHALSRAEGEVELVEILHSERVWKS